MDYNQSTANTLATIISKRRTVKPHSYSGEEIPREIVEKIMASTNWAPSHGRTEPWRFKVFCGSGKLKLLQMLKDIYTRNTPPDKFKAEKIEKMNINCTKSSHIVAIMMKRQEIERIPEIEEVQAVACAVQNLHLSATAYGACGYWSSGAITYLDDTREALGLDTKDRVLGFFYLGLPETEIKEGVRNSPYTDKIEWVEE